MIVLCPWWSSAGDVKVLQSWHLANEGFDGRGIVVVGQAFAVVQSRAGDRLVQSCSRAVASSRSARAVVQSRARARLVGLYAASLGADGGGLRRVIARGDGRKCRGVRYPEVCGKPCFGGVYVG
jgi:hypothetical protein